MAVYTTVDDTALTELLTAYDIGEFSTLLALLKVLKIRIIYCEQPKHILS